ncbi:hypothetical protein TIFTF001_036279 [Ficus carica]|uniref:Uncharacterized protein n=1 Tax=Ficus carica TaxID=3494 RepID=A0AA88E4Y5_FICCA|nr:hypothetical protein TIFTF001_036279 [Ficus carica]
MVSEPTPRPAAMPPHLCQEGRDAVNELAELRNQIAQLQQNIVTEVLAALRDNNPPPTPNVGPPPAQADISVFDDKDDDLAGNPFAPL